MLRGRERRKGNDRTCWSSFVLFYFFLRARVVRLELDNSEVERRYDKKSNQRLWQIIGAERRGAKRENVFVRSREDVRISTRIRIIN